MADDKDQPIIIKKKKGGGHGHHGGAWKIAYADFVTAMMAFFLVLWIVGLDVKTRNGLAEYFANPGAFKIDYRSSPYIMKTDGRPPVMNDKVEQASRPRPTLMWQKPKPSPGGSAPPLPQTATSAPPAAVST